MYVYVNFLCFYVRYKKISKCINQKQDIICPLLLQPLKCP